MPLGNLARMDQIMTTENDDTNTKLHSKREIGSPLLPEGSAGAVQRWYPTQWPRVCGKALLPLPDDAFLTDTFLSRYRPGFLTFAYAGGCGYHPHSPAAQGLAGIARQLNAPLHKLSATTQSDPTNRLRELNRGRYGALRMTEEGHLCSGLGFDTWTFQVLLPVGKPLEGSPVTVEERGLSVRLPADLGSEEFEKRLHDMMKDSSLGAWLDTPDGIAHCKMAGIDRNTIRLYSTYGFNAAWRRSVANEIYFFRPKTDDVDRLIRIIEVIIHRHVTLGAAMNNVSWLSLGQGITKVKPL